MRTRGLTEIKRMTWRIGMLKSSLFWANRNERKKLLVLLFSHPRKIAFVENGKHKTSKKILGTGELNGDEYRGRPLAKKHINLLNAKITQFFGVLTSGDLLRKKNVYPILYLYNHR